MIFELIKASSGYSGHHEKPGQRAGFAQEKFLSIPA
jgi:hypothetical protein